MHVNTGTQKLTDIPAFLKRFKMGNGKNKRLMNKRTWNGKHKKGIRCSYLLQNFEQYLA